MCNKPIRLSLVLWVIIKKLDPPKWHLESNLSPHFMATQKLSELEEQSDECLYKINLA